MLQASSTASDGARVDWRWLGRRIFLLALLMLGAVGTESAAAPTETKLLDPLGSANASFGHDAALSGNYAIVGARYDATQGFDGGKAVIFGFDGSQWQVQSHLLPPASSDYATFAQSVDISGDYAIVGTPYLGEHDANQTGSATIYVRSGTTWTQQAVLVGSDTAKGDRFGYSVAIDGDYALVGAPDHAALGADAGATYVFLRSGASWSQQAKLLASDGAADMEFGSDVALSGARAVVGVDIQAPGPNYAYSFERTTTLWTQTARFKAGDVIDSDRFGASLALSGPTLIAGAYFHGHPPSIGSAYAFDYVSSSGGWVERKEFLENSTLIDFLGFAVGLDGDLAGVGAVNADGNQPSSGVANFYRRTPYGGWAKSAKVSASDTIQYHAFGHAIGISGDCAIVGAIHDTSMGTNAGAAYVYCGFPIPLVEIEIHVICCFQIPDFGTGPVEIEIRFTNLLDQPQTIQTWVEVVGPDGAVLDMTRRSEVEIDIGETLVVPYSYALPAGSSIGGYQTIAYWVDADGEHSEPTNFQIVPSIPALHGLARALLAAALLAAPPLAVVRRRAYLLTR